MSIADPQYLLLLIPVVGLFYALNSSRLRVALVLVASYLFYLTFPAWFLPILLVMTVFAYGAGLFVQRIRGTRAHWPVAIVLVIMGLISPMILFKVLSVEPVSLIYPVGLSFYTFTLLAYLIDVALDVEDAETRPQRLAVAASFFPVLTLGPLLRTQYFDRLDFDAVKFERSRVAKGLSEVVVGMALKVGAADVLALTSDAVYDNVSSTSAIELFAGSAVELFQIYADWQAYSLIAIGSARLFGIDFPSNFPQPYLSSNIGEFWRRWNVSLVNWFRDYVFMPVRVQFKSSSKRAVPVATFVTFLLFGAWHVRWGWLNYVAYGAVNGILLIVSQQTLAARDRMWRKVGVSLNVLTPFRILVTFLILVMTVPLARSHSMSEALSVYSAWLGFRELDFNVPVLQYTQLVVVPIILLLIVSDVVVRHFKSRHSDVPFWLNTSVVAACLVYVAWHAATGQPIQPFVYYRF